MVEVTKSLIYIGEEARGNLMTGRSPDQILPVDENMMRKKYMIDGTWRLIKGVSYRMQRSGKFTKIIVVE